MLDRGIGFVYGCRDGSRRGRRNDRRMGAQLSVGPYPYRPAYDPLELRQACQAILAILLGACLVKLGMSGTHAHCMLYIERVARGTPRYKGMCNEYAGGNGHLRACRGFGR